MDKIMNMPPDSCNGPQVSQVSQILDDKNSVTETSDMPAIHHNESSQDTASNDITSDSRPKNDKLETIREVIFWRRFNEFSFSAVIQRVLTALPEAAGTAATFTTLAPISELIGKGVKQTVDAITKRKKV